MLICINVKRHAETWFDLTLDEQVDALSSNYK